MLQITERIKYKPTRKGMKANKDLKLHYKIEICDK